MTAALESELEAARTRLGDLEEDNASYQSRAERYQ